RPPASPARITRAGGAAFARRVKNSGRTAATRTTRASRDQPDGAGHGDQAQMSAQRGAQRSTRHGRPLAGRGLSLLQHGEGRTPRELPSARVLCTTKRTVSPESARKPAYHGGKAPLRVAREVRG